MTKEEAQEAIGRLIAKYQSWSPRQRQLNEQQTRTQFILPLLQVLGWDINNPAEVSEEFSVAGDRVDYALHIDGVPKLFLEAKKLGAELENEEYIKKAITYAQNKGITWVVLTNFEQLMVFNADWDDPFWQRARFLSLNFQDYISDFDRLWWLSREAVNLGVLEEEARKVGQLRPKLPVEKSLLEKLRRWRAELFNQISQYNEGLSPFDIDHRIQLLLNRLIFIRAAEDRITKVGRLRAELNQWRHNERRGELIERLRSVFGEFAEQYDSDLFPNLAMPGQDPWSQLFVGSMALEKIIQGLYDHPGRLSGYDFSAIDADILGRVYEQYLGYVAQEIQQQFAQIPLMGPQPSFVELEEKRAKRKQQGIYYTPKFVVDYIVDQTVGRFLRERSHNEILNMKILDPACGSGSFLIAAYDRLLRYHAHQQGKSVSQLSPAQRAQFLTGNIFGVDLDLQAVEMARLNLLLKALFQAALLPPLHDNIRRGNSLISGSPEELKRYFGNNWRDKHHFNWEEEFPDIMKAGGFDVVIGNPPYVRIQSLLRHEANFYRDHFKSAYGSFDIYVLFIEQGTRLLKKEGGLGFICSGKFLKSKYGKPLQQLLFTEGEVKYIVDLSAQQVFAEATTYPVVITFQKAAKGEPIYYTPVPEQLFSAETLPTIDMGALPTQPVPQKAINQGVWPPLAQDLQAKLDANSTPLKEVADRIFVGLQTSADNVYILEKRGESKERLIRVYSRATGTEHYLEATLLKPFLTGKNISPYYSPIPRQLLLFPYQISQGKAILISGSDFQKLYPSAWEYLNLNRGILEQREQGKFHGEGWYRLGRTQNLAIHEQPKLAIPSTVKRLTACYDYLGAMYLDNVRVNGILLKQKDDAAYKYLTGLMNSKLLHWFFSRVATPFANGWFGANRQFIESLPIRRIDFDNPAEKKLHDDLVALVERMLDLKKRWTGLGRFAEEERRELEKEIERTDRAIDNLVYDLYGLTEEERQIIEAEGRR